MFDHGRSAAMPATASDAVAEIDRADALIAEIREIEEQIAALSARQLLVTAELVESCRVTEFGSSRRASTASQTVVAMQVAAARKISLASAERFIVDAEQLVTDLPRVVDVLEAGLTTMDAVRAVVHEAVNVPPELSADFDAAVSDDLLDLPIASQARAAARRRACTLNPQVAQRGAEAARRERYVTVRPSVGIGSATLSAVLPAEQAEYCYGVLSHQAQLARHGGDERSVSQIMADTMVERLTGQSTASSVPVSVGLVMNVTTLLGTDDVPAHLLGQGVLPAPIARLLATSDSAWLRRLFADPVDGTVAHADTRRRRFDGGLRDLILARDQECRAPGCTSRIAHLDHDHAYSEGGPTSASNGRGYNVHCHTVKHSPDVATFSYRRPGSTHAASTRWELSIGPPLASLPPPALGHGSTTLTQNRQRREIRRRLTT